MDDVRSKIIGNPSSIDHSFGQNSKEIFDEALESVCDVLNITRDEFVLTSGATEANNLAVLGVAAKLRNGRRKRVLMGPLEHSSVSALVYPLENYFGFTTEVVPCLDTGVINMSALSEMLDHDVAMVTISAVSGVCGTVQPLSEISELVRSVGACFHSDATQALYNFTGDRLTELCDMYSISGHKIGGPNGVGGLVIDSAWLNQIDPIIWGGGQQAGLRSGTLPVELMVGFSAAIVQLGSAQSQHDNGAQLLWNQLSNAYEARLVGPLPGLVDRHPANLLVIIPNFDFDLWQHRTKGKFAVSRGSACQASKGATSELRRLNISVCSHESFIRIGLPQRSSRDDISSFVASIALGMDVSS